MNLYTTWAIFSLGLSSCAHSPQNPLKEYTYTPTLRSPGFKLSVEEKGASLAGAVGAGLAYQPLHHGLRYADWIKAYGINFESMAQDRKSIAYFIYNAVLADSFQFYDKVLYREIYPDTARNYEVDFYQSAMDEFTIDATTKQPFSWCQSLQIFTQGLPGHNGRGQWAVDKTTLCLSYEYDSIFTGRPSWLEERSQRWTKFMEDGILPQNDLPLDNIAFYFRSALDTSVEFRVAYKARPLYLRGRTSQMPVQNKDVVIDVPQKFPRNKTMPSHLPTNKILSK